MCCSAAQIYKERNNSAHLNIVKTNCLQTEGSVPLHVSDASAVSARSGQTVLGLHRALLETTLNQTLEAYDKRKETCFDASWFYI